MSHSVARPAVSYRVLVGLDYPTNPHAVERILAGEDVPWAERGARRAEPGDVVRDLPAASIPGLLAKGRIEEVSPPVGDGEGKGV